jgi:CRISPR-associated protein Cas2
LEILLAYDVSTASPGGEARLRRVADACQAFGQRVQKSLFECRITASDMEILRSRVLREMDQRFDSLRIYRLREPHGRFTEVYGVRPEFDLHDPLVL